MKFKPSDNFLPSTQSCLLSTQLALVLLLVLLLSGLGSGIIQLVGKLLEMDYLTTASALTATSPIPEKNFIRFCLGVGQLCTFTIPALLFMVLLSKKYWSRDLQLNHFPSLISLFLGAIFMLLLFPLVQWIYWLNKQIPLPGWAVNQEDLINGTISSLLQINNFYELGLNLLVIGILPALGEELIFRGILQRKLETIWQKPYLAIWISALIFSGIHLQFQGFLPRVLLGATLGYLFVWTRNLWIPIFAHFIFNASQVLLQYFSYLTKQGSLNLEEVKQFPAWITLLSIILLFYVGKSIRDKESS